VSPPLGVAVKLIGLVKEAGIGPTTAPLTVSKSSWVGEMKLSESLPAVLDNVNAPRLPESVPTTIEAA